MYCPNCNSPIDESEFFCGNCGINLRPKNPESDRILSTGFVEKTLPQYAKLKTVPKVSFSTYTSYVSFFAGLIIALFVSPLFGLLAGFVGIVSASFISRKFHLVHKIVGFVLASLLIISSIADISYNYSVLKRNQSANKINSSSQLISSTVNTNCYSFNFSASLHLSSNNSGCSILAYNGSTINNSTMFYKILSVENHNINSTNFSGFIGPIIIQDIKQSMVGFNIVSEKTTMFAGNLAYAVVANSATTNSSVIEEGVYHPSSSANFFDIIYANDYPNVDLSALQSSWSWKKY